MSEEDKLYCPKCGSTQLTANKKGFGAGKAAAGAILTGGVGLLAGFIGSGNVNITCLKCGATMKPGELRSVPLPIRQRVSHQNINGWLVVVPAIIIPIVLVVLIMVKCS